MQLEAERYSITATNSSSTRNLKGRGPAAHMQLLGCRREDSPHGRRERLRLPSRCFTRNEEQGHYPSTSDARRATHSLQAGE